MSLLRLVRLILWSSFFLLLLRFLLLLLLLPSLKTTGRLINTNTHTPRQYLPNQVPSKWNKDILVNEYNLSDSKVQVVIQGINTKDPFNPSLYDKPASRKKVRGLVFFFFLIILCYECLTW